MTIAGFTPDDFLEILTYNGYTVLSSKYYDTQGVSRIVLNKDGGQSFVLKVKGFMSYIVVIAKLDSLEVKAIPEKFKEMYEHCQTAFAQHKALSERRNNQ